MTAPTLETTRTTRESDGALAEAATRLYDAEIALHIARQTGVDSWVAAAYDRLHVAIGEHRAALANATSRACAGFGDHPDRNGGPMRATRIGATSR
jgi:hypothetical protein